MDSLASPTATLSGNRLPHPSGTFPSYRGINSNRLTLRTHQTFRLRAILRRLCIIDIRLGQRNGPDASISGVAMAAHHSLQTVRYGKWQKIAENTLGREEAAALYKQVRNAVWAESFGPRPGGLAFPDGRPIL